ncbi:MAG: hypothetical protein J6Y96_01105 [Mycoplasma sp.]|nr:hypothetical protein [Mycoplasma sp.]
MKRFHKLQLLLCSAISIAPVVMSTSCTPSYRDSIHEVKFNKNDENPVSKSLGECSTLKKSLQDLICGTKKFHSGNYMLIFGSECSQSSNKFFSGEPLVKKTHDDYFRPDAFVNSIFYNSVKKPQFYNASVDFGLVLYIDIESEKTANKDLLRPNSATYRKFDEKWSGDDVKEAEDREINTKKKEVIVEGEYKRKDKSAVTMRKLLDYLTKMFTPEVFSCKSSEDLPYCLVWKDGIPSKDNSKKISGDNSLSIEEYFDNVLNFWIEKEH